MTLVDMDVHFKSVAMIAVFDVQTSSDFVNDTGGHERVFGIRSNCWGV